jgi:hypothetical protein
MKQRLILLQNSSHRARILDVAELTLGVKGVLARSVAVATATVETATSKSLRYFEVIDIH